MVIYSLIHIYIYTYDTIDTIFSTGVQIAMWVFLCNHGH